ncbi:hypothetical protein GCM10011297_31850 [Bacterioplanes sanyensis]|nr:hypothetical protein GCM10011297_31850 [Bacterioplanes sanyensis]
MMVCLPMALVGCQLSEEDKDKLDDAQTNLEQLADQIIITHPVNQSVVHGSTIGVRADIPTTAGVQEMVLFVDGIEVARDTDGEPWQVTWPAYFWADENAHSLMLKAVTKSGNEVRNNQQFWVYVDASANEILSFESPVANTVIKDQNSLKVVFKEFPGATKYEVKYINDDIEQKIETQATEVELTDLAVGEYELSYRAFNQERVGPWSEPVTFEVAATDLPALNAAEISPSESGYDVRLSWQDMGEESTYRVELTSLTNAEDSSVHEDISGTELLLSDLPTGRYEWRLTRINSLNQASQPSQPEALELGIFSKVLGGARDDYAEKIIPSRQGGYIVLGVTQSKDIADNVGVDGDDWVIKLDEQGEVEWQYIDYAAGRSRLDNIIELADGSVIAFGSDFVEKTAIALKLSSEGSSLWEVHHGPTFDRHAFVDTVEFNGSLYVSAVKWDYPTCRGCTKERVYSLHTISLGDGTISDPIELPELEGMERQSIQKLIKTSSGELLLAGMANRTDDASIRVIASGAYIQTLNTDLAEVSVWNNVGELFYGNLGDVTELSNGRFAIIGQGMNEGNAYIALVHSNKGDLELYREATSTYSYINQPLTVDSDGSFYVALSSKSIREGSIKLVKFSDEAAFISELTDDHVFRLSQSRSLSVSGLIRNDDGTFTYAVNNLQPSKSTDIEVVKSVFQ